MASSNLSETPIGREVERLFGEISAKRGDLCTNPVTGGEFVYGFDSIKRQKDAAYKRLLATRNFASHVPPDAPLMPTDDYERNRAKHASGLLGFITAQFAWSLESQDDLRAHPSFADFASGMLWQHDNNVEGYSLGCFPSDQIAELKRRFPPRKLEGLNRLRLVPAAAAKTTKGNPASCLTGSLLIGANGGNYAGVDVQGKNARRSGESCRGRVGRSVAAHAGARARQSRLL